MPKSKKDAKRRAKLRKRRESGQDWHQKLERKRLNDRATAEQAQAKEPKEKYSIDDIAGRA